MRHLFPDFNQWLGAMPDPRVPGKCDYPAVLELWCGLALLLDSAGSRAQYDLDRFKPAMIANVKGLAGVSATNLPDGDTVNYLLELMPAADGLGLLPAKMVHRLIRNKVLDDYRVWDDYVMIAIDATEQLSSAVRHCDQCLVQELSDGSQRYFHAVLQAMVVARNGLVLPLLSEPIRNESGTYDKQDCELKAFFRLAPRLHRLFPQLRICLLMDSLYFCQDLMELCEPFHWEWIITFKEGRTPALWERAQKALKPENRLVHQRDDSTQQCFRWCHNLIHGTQRHRLHAIFCTDTTRDANGAATVRNFAWGTTLRPDRKNVVELANHGGRSRWKIENEGFNTLKNSIGGLDHGYGTMQEALMNWHHLIEVAYLLLQLIEHGNILSKLPPPPEAARAQRPKPQTRIVLARYGTLKNFRDHLRGAFRWFVLAFDRILKFPPFQFRLAPNTS